MVVLVLTACPSGLRGDVSRWLLEIAPGVFVGRVSARVRERLWERVVSLVRGGRAIMVFTARNEQHFDFKVHQPDWLPVDCDGVRLMCRPAGTDNATLVGAPAKGWSDASKHRKAKRFGSR